MTCEKRLLVFFGMIASGKSYLAGACAGKWGCSYYNSDVIRKELAGVTATSRQNNSYSSGIYSNEFSRKTYESLLAHARKDFGEEGPACVILDASYQSSEQRRHVCSEFGSGVHLLFVYCRCDESVLKRRMEKRLKDPTCVSDGRWEIYVQQKRRFEPPVEIPGGQLITLDTDRSLEHLIEMLEKVLQ